MRKTRDRLFVAVLLAGLALLLWLGLAEPHADEDACIAIGWLLSRGWTLYSGIFSHHTPLDFIPSWAIAKVFGPAPVLCRVFMIVLWAAVCSALYSIKKDSKEGASTAILFTGLSALWLTYWMGQLMLVEQYWGYSALLLLGLIDERRWTAGLAACGGALLGIVLCATPTCAPAFLLLAAPLIRCGRLRALAAGFFAMMVPTLLWSALHADARLWYDDVFRFNAQVYTAFSGVPSGKPLALLIVAARETAVYFARTFSWTGLEDYFEGLLRLAVLAHILRLAWKSRFLDAIWWAAFIVSLRLRGERFLYIPRIHGSSYYLAATWLFAKGVVDTWHELNKKGLATAWTAAIAVAAAVSIAPTAWATHWVVTHRTEAPGRSWLISTIRAGTDENDPIFVAQIYPRLYIDAARVPAAPGVFYLPWQAAWRPEHDRVLQALRERPPKLIYAADAEVWDVPWSAYGADVMQLVASDYIEVRARSEDEALEKAALYVRRDWAEELLKRCPSCVIPAGPGRGAAGRPREPRALPHRKA